MAEEKKFEKTIHVFVNKILYVSEKKKKIEIKLRLNED